MSVMLGLVLSMEAQYKAPRDYFPKNFPTNNLGGQRPATPAPPAATNAIPPAAAVRPPVVVAPKFKELATNTQFFFVTDTNRAYAWTKISASTAKNTKNNAVAPVNPETPVQR